jgi:hypothetical protein
MPRDGQIDLLQTSAMGVHHFSTRYVQGKPESERAKTRASPRATIGFKMLLHEEGLVIGSGGGRLVGRLFPRVSRPGKNSCRTRMSQSLPEERDQQQKYRSWKKSCHGLDHPTGQKTSARPTDPRIPALLVYTHSHCRFIGFPTFDRLDISHSLPGKHAL